MKLNYCERKLNIIYQTTPIIMLHGLFGNLSNLTMLSNYLMQYNHIIQIDLRNHGKSPHKKSMTYYLMAQDVLKLLDNLLINRCIVIGHSMGGKVAMMLCMLAANRIHKIIVIDIAPIKYHTHNFNNVFHAIELVNQSITPNRIEAAKLMKKYISNPTLINFLMKSFHQGLWDFNFISIRNNFNHINDWENLQIWNGPALFIKGQKSTYIHDKYIDDIYRQFPKAYIYNVSNAGHWVHYENFNVVLNIIKKFILNK